MTEFLLRNLTPQILYRQNDESGGSGDDPRDGDERLVKWFKAALSAQRNRPSSTANPYGLISAVQEIIERTDNVPHLLLLDNELRPIAQRLLNINFGDRENPGIVTHEFENFEL